MLKLKQVRINLYQQSMMTENADRMYAGLDTSDEGRVLLSFKI